MAYNLLITYDLDKPGQNYDAVHAKIQSLGSWYHPQQSVYYLHTALSAQQAHAAILTVLDANDRLIVADVTMIVITPAPQQDVDAINAIWHAAA